MGGCGTDGFGSPKNRIKGELTHSEAISQAAGLFREVGDACAEAGSCLVIEANPPAYGADFCNTLAQAADLVEAVDSPGFGLHVDAGGMVLGADDFEATLRQCAGRVRHVHASQPHLASFSEPDPIHGKISGILRETGYHGSVAIEMRAQPEGLTAVENAVKAVRAIYDKDCIEIPNRRNTTAR